jgi:hypothetical protein
LSALIAVAQECSQPVEAGLLLARSLDVLQAFVANGFHGRERL